MIIDQSQFKNSGKYLILHNIQISKSGWKILHFQLKFMLAWPIRIFEIETLG